MQKMQLDYIVIQADPYYFTAPLWVHDQYGIGSIF